MIHYASYYVHLLKQVAPEWTDGQWDDYGDIIDDAEFCGLLELVAVLYLRQRGNPLASELIVGARLPNDHEMAGYKQPFMTDSLHGLRPLLRRLIADLDAMPGSREIDAELEAELEAGTDPAA